MARGAGGLHGLIPLPLVDGGILCADGDQEGP